MKALGTIFVSLFTALAVVACSTVDVTTDYDHSAAFGTYRTYSLAPGPDSRDLPIYCEMALRKVVHDRLAERGVAEATGPDADLAIVWHVFLTDRTSAREMAEQRSGGRWDYAYGFYTSWTGAPNNYSNATPYPDGTLLLDVVDMRTKRLVFRGTGTAVAMGPESGARNIEKAVTKMVAALPATH
ncbi:MAG TPA: DUF4136 domain-containing protein [Candidatus Binatia bacterium]|jgi:hypothetical protein